MENNVKRIYFKKNSEIPYFELENGEIKRPFIKQSNAGILTIWLTEEEHCKRRDEKTTKSFWNIFKLW